MNTYKETLLQAADVCANCLRPVREERQNPVRSGLGREYETTLTRREETTTVGYGPSEAVSDSRGVFCDCGVEGHRVNDRVWTADDLTHADFRELLKQSVRTLEAKGVSLKRRETLAYALQSYDDGRGPDEAIALGVEAGIVAATASTDTPARAATPAD